MAVALYPRVSTVRQAEADLSIPDQLNQMREWCRQNGLTIAREYIEPGASATDDKRPVFQEMIDDATRKPYPYEAIIVHSRSRFYRDLYGALHYERKLAHAGVRVISITQPTTDDETGELLRNLISMMDGYSSRENAKHTSRAMRENARRGFFNGSRAPFGYQVVATDVPGHKGKVRKRLAVDEMEARVVRQIYELYLKGHEGYPLGMKAIAAYLNERKILMRGHVWRIQKVADLLADRTYRGEYCYNMRDSRSGVLRPESQWVRCPVEAIVDEATFDAVRRIRQARDPKQEASPAAKQATSPTLLAGKIKCDCCGVAMTQATGKSGRYRYYKCANKIAISATACATPNLPLERMDRLILERLVDRVLTPERVTAMLRQWLAHQAKTQGKADIELKKLERALKAAEDGLNNLYAAIEKGVVALDSSLQARVNRLKDEREQILAAMATVKRDKPSPSKLSPKQVAYACGRMREMLLDPNAGYGKQLLGLLVTEIRVKPGLVTMTGSTAVLNQAVSEMKLGTPFEVPSIVLDWRARDDSNVRPLPSEGSTLSN
jgi:site-specific DNA recombinase